MKRILLSLLCAAMILSFLPVSAISQEEEAASYQEMEAPDNDGAGDTGADAEADAESDSMEEAVDADATDPDSEIAQEIAREGDDTVTDATQYTEPVVEDEQETTAASDSLTEEELAFIYDEANYEAAFEPGQVIVKIETDAGLPQSGTLVSPLLLTSRASSAVSALSDDLDIVDMEDLSATSAVTVSAYSLAASKTEYTLLLTLADDSSQGVLDAIDILRDESSVVYAQPNYRYEAAQVPNDPYYQYDYMWNIDRASFIEAWETTTGDACVAIGVLDSGVQYDHEDLAENIDTSLAYNSYKDSTQLSDVQDTFGHGTHVAGIIGASGNNATGVVGTNWNVSIVPIKITDDTASAAATTLSLWRALNYAETKKLAAVNISYAFFEGENYEMALQDAIRNYSGLVVGAAGNSNRNLGAYFTYDCENLILVGNTTSADERYSNSTSGSNYGATTVDLFAPGTYIYSTFPGNTYSKKTGTSMAAPHVTGTAALLWAYDPSLTAAEVKQAILESVDQVEELSTLCSTGGRLNAYKALQYVKETDIVVYTFFELEDALANDSFDVIGIGTDIQLESAINLTRSVALVPFDRDSVTLTALEGERHFITSGEDMVLGLSGIVLYGGGIQCEKSTTIWDGTICNSTLFLAGGGIYMSDTAASLTLKNVDMEDNEANYGGGVYAPATCKSLTIWGGNITGNLAFYGGGIACEGVTTLMRVNISGNNAPFGGGIVNQGTTSIERCEIADNAAFYAGGIYNLSGEIILADTVIRNNKGSCGGGIYNCGDLIMVGGTISGNTATNSGGGINNYAGTLYMMSGTIQNNKAERYGGGIYNGGGGDVMLMGGTISGNTPSDTYGV